MTFPAMRGRWPAVVALAAGVVLLATGTYAQVGTTGVRPNSDRGAPSSGNPSGASGITSSQPENLGQAGAGRSGTGSGGAAGAGIGGDQHPPARDSSGIGAAPTTGPSGPMDPSDPSGTGSR
jgi:hypothetical protein